MIKRFVNFLYPGSFLAETETVETGWIGADMVIEMVKTKKQRPYAFFFTTRHRGEYDFDSKETERSCTYYLGGNIKTLAEVKAENNPKNEILIQNMECNKWDKIIVTRHGAIPLNPDDVVLEFTYD